jgi:hypothetical protein
VFINISQQLVELEKMWKIYTVLKNSRASLFKEAAFTLAGLKLYAAQAQIWHIHFPQECMLILHCIYPLYLLHCHGLGLLLFLISPIQKYFMKYLWYQSTTSLFMAMNGVYKILSYRSPSMSNIDVLNYSAPLFFLGNIRDTIK